MWAIIGGSGFEQFDDVQALDNLNRETPFGETSSGFRRILFNGTECLFLPRHGSRHELLPSEINYAGNIFALKKAGATRICSVSAVGSLKKELEPGHLVIPFQYIDRTKGIRKTTFCGNGIVGHVSLARPVWEYGAHLIQQVASNFDFSVHLQKTYVCIEGPYFSTQAESRSYRQMGADIIGMTNFPEFALAKEAGLPYLPLCFVTDYDSWSDTLKHATLQQVITLMGQNNQKAKALLKSLMALTIDEKELIVEDRLISNLLPTQEIHEAQKQILELLGR